MPQVTLHYTLWTKTESRTFEHEAEFEPLPSVGDSIDAFFPAVEPYDVVRIDQDAADRTIVILEHWDPDAPEDRPVDWDNPFTQADVRDLIDGGWREVRNSPRLSGLVTLTSRASRINRGEAPSVRLDRDPGLPECGSLLPLARSHVRR